MPEKYRKKSFQRIQSGKAYLASYAMEMGLIQPKYQRLVIVTTGRTGSTMLVDCLNQHPEIQMYYEVFNQESEKSSPRWRKLLLENTIKYLHYRVYGYHPSKIRVVGFKIHYYHCQEDTQRAVWHYLANNVDKIIHLKRDLVESYVSGQLAKKHKTWHVYQQEKLSYMDRASLTIEPAELQLYLEEKTAERRRFDELFAGKDLLEVWYNDLNENLSRELFHIQEWLGLTPEKMHPTSFKQNNRRLDEIISNYGELQTYFQQTEWVISFP